jgi:hypothetical protein
LKKTGRMFLTGLQKRPLAQSALWWMMNESKLSGEDATKLAYLIMDQVLAKAKAGNNTAREILLDAARVLEEGKNTAHRGQASKPDGYLRKVSIAPNQKH